MKTNYKILFVVTIILFSNLFIMNINAKENYQIYPINDKLMINNVFKFYDDNNKSVIKVVVNENKKNNELEEEITNSIEEIEVNNQVYDNASDYGNEANFDSLYIELAEYALQFVGNPYVYGGTSLTEGTDCSGFVMRLYEHFGVNLPRTASAQSKVGYSVKIENAQPGDIISYGYNGIVSHSAIYIGDGEIIHAATPQDGITTASMYMMPIITIRRIG